MSALSWCSDFSFIDAKGVTWSATIRARDYANESQDPPIGLPPNLDVWQIFPYWSGSMDSTSLPPGEAEVLGAFRRWAETEIRLHRYIRWYFDT